MYILNKNPKEYVINIKEDNHIINMHTDPTISCKNIDGLEVSSFVNIKSNANKIDDKKLKTKQKEIININSDFS